MARRSCGWVGIEAFRGEGTRGSDTDVTDDGLNQLVDEILLQGLCDCDVVF